MRTLSASDRAVKRKRSESRCPSVAILITVAIFCAFLLYWEQDAMQTPRQSMPLSAVRSAQERPEAPFHLPEPGDQAEPVPAIDGTDNTDESTTSPSLSPQLNLAVAMDEVVTVRDEKDSTLRASGDRVSGDDSL